MHESDRRMIDAQAKHITALRTDLEYAHRKIASLQAEVNSTKTAGTFYKKMQKAILNNPVLQGEWVRFCSFLRMAEPELEAEFEEVKDTIYYEIY